MKKVVYPCRGISESATTLDDLSLEMGRENASNRANLLGVRLEPQAASHCTHESQEIRFSLPFHSRGASHPQGKPAPKSMIQVLENFLGARKCPNLVILLPTERPPTSVPP